MSLRFLVRHRVSVASTLVVIAAVVALVAYALDAVGFDVHHADLNDGGVWVSGSPYGAFARLNKPVEQFDGAVSLGASATNNDLDIVQDGVAVFGLDKSTGKLSALDGSTMTTVPGQSASVPVDASVQVGGADPGVLAVADPKSGKVWATTVGTSTFAGVNLAAVDNTAKPVAKVGANARVAVATDGTVFAVSTDGTLTTIRAAGGRFRATATRTLGAFARQPAIATVGTTPVVLDGAHLWIGSHAPVTFDGIGSAVLQQSSAAAPAVVLATTTSVVQVPMASGRAAVSPADGTGGGMVVAPIQLDGCIYSAWAGAAASYRTMCPAAHVDFHGSLAVDASTALSFRVNRHEEVLNDGGSGKVWNVDGKSAVELDSWDAVLPKPGSKTTSDKEVAGQAKPPQAKPDTEDVRAGRSSVLHLLDNDTRPPTDTIAIVNTTQPAASGYHVSISGDEQTVAVSVPPDATGDTTFQYSITGSNDTTATTATVTLHIVPPGTDSAPHRCTCAVPPAWPVGATSQLEIPVRGDGADRRPAGVAGAPHHHAHRHRAPLPGDMPGASRSANSGCRST
ncbi:MAG: Ig-like domain-containing protein [Jatrophihabitans sp.]|uniref:Ig-like domain-containing protein n=1 Tax=Jatrophihabitans sp. TaxID=1932789 RepID=UPI003F8080D5